MVANESQVAKIDILAEILREFAEKKKAPKTLLSRLFRCPPYLFNSFDMFLNNNAIGVDEDTVALVEDAEENEVADFFAFLTFSSDLIHRLIKQGYLLQVEDLQVFEALWLLPPPARDFLCDKLIETYASEQDPKKQRVLSFYTLMTILFPEPDEPERIGDWEIVRQIMKTAGAEMVGRGAVEILQYVWRWNGKTEEIVTETTKDSLSIVRMDKRKRVASKDVMAALFRCCFGEESWMVNLGDRELILQVKREIGKDFKITSDYADSRSVDSIFIEGSRVTSMNLSVFTPSVFRLPNLRRLHLFSLKNPETFSSQTEDWSTSQLEELIITSVEISELPPSLGSLTKLKRIKLQGENAVSLLLSGKSSLIPSSVREVDLSDSRITQLDSKMFQRIPHVEVLFLNNNALTGIPNEIGQMVKLRELHLKKNKLEGLPAELSSIPTLSTITVNGNPTAFFEHLPKVILELNIRKFTTLDIPQNEKMVLGYIQAMIEQELTLSETPSTDQGFSVENHHLAWIGIPNELIFLPSIVFSLPFLRKVQIGSRSFEIIKCAISN